MARVVLHRDHVRIQGNPHRLRTDEIEYLVRAVLWRLAAEGPKERRKWRRWAEVNRPGPLVWSLPRARVRGCKLLRKCARLLHRPVTPPRACARLQGLTVTSLSPERATLSR